MGEMGCETCLPVHKAMPSSETPRQLTRLSCPARMPTLGGGSRGGVRGGG